MKKIFAKELAALAVLAIAFTGCNTAFDGTNANFSEKEAEYTDRSGATQTATTGSVSSNGSTITINNTNKKNEVTVTVTCFSKLDTATEKDAILFQQLTNNATTGYYPTRGANLPKTLIKVDESYNSSTNTATTVFTYEVDGTGVTANKIALFVDAAKLKTKGGSAALNLDGNTKRGEESDCYIEYLLTNGTTTTITGTENFRPTYTPVAPASTGTTINAPTALVDSSSKLTGVYRLNFVAENKKNRITAGAADDYENGLAAKLNDAVILQYREPGKTEYAEKKLSFTYHDAASTVATDPYDAHTYTADFGPLAIGTEYRVVIKNPEGLTAPAWYKDAYGHAGIVYTAGNGVGAISNPNAYVGTYTLHSTVPTYIVSSTGITSGSDATSSYVPSPYAKNTIRSAQAGMFSVTPVDNWFEVRLTTGELSPTAASDFIVVDGNNKKVASEVQVITYNDASSNNGKVNYVKILIKDPKYRNMASDYPQTITYNYEVNQSDYLATRTSDGSTVYDGDGSVTTDAHKTYTRGTERALDGSGNPMVHPDTSVPLYKPTANGKVTFSVTGSNSNKSVLKVAVGKGTKIVENKTYPSQVTFGVWEDVADDDLSGYVKIN